MQELVALQCVLDALDDCLIAFAIIDDCVAFATIEELLNMLCTLASNYDQRVDVRARGELQDV